MLGQVEAKPTNTPFWKGLMRIKNNFFKRGYFEVGDELKVRFWGELWLGDTSCVHQYPSSYNIVQWKNILVENALAETPPNIAFSRTIGYIYISG
jgi:hypothetical protein